MEQPTSQPTKITHTKATRVNVGANYSLRIYFTVSGASAVKSLYLTRTGASYQLPVNPIAEGEQFVQDNLAGSTGGGAGIEYKFNYTLADGKLISEPFKVYY